MFSKRITCKLQDWLERITHVGVEFEGVKPMVEVWDLIWFEGQKFHTNVYGKTTIVRAKLLPDGTKYLTTSPDNFKPNNLDELMNCVY